MHRQSQRALKYWIGGPQRLPIGAAPEATSAQVGALTSMARQGYGDYRHLMAVKVADLADRLRDLGPLRLEHIHDY